MIIGGGMMKFEELQTFVHEKMTLVKYDPKTLRDPMDRATEFLVVLANLNDFRFRCECDKARIQTITEGLFKQAKDSSDAKNITEKKVDAVVNPQYSNARETLEDIEGMIKWVRTAIDIFNNAHLTYRQLARD